MNDNLSYEEVIAEILDLQAKRLRKKEVASIKVLWRNHLVKGEKMEDEVDMKSFYRYLFHLTPSQS